MKTECVRVLVVDNDWPIWVKLPPMVVDFLDLEHGDHRDWVRRHYQLIKYYRRPDRLPGVLPPRILPPEAFNPGSHVPVRACVEALALKLFAEESGTCVDL